MLSIALPLSLEFQHDLAQHAESVLNNEIKALQLRPTLERRNSISTLSSCSSISPPPDPDFPRAVRRESVAYDTSARFDTRLIDLTKARSDCPFIDLTQSHQISIMTVSTQSPWWGCACPWLRDSHVGAEEWHLQSLRLARPGSHRPARN